MRSRIASDDGQASVEHIGLMALVAAVLLAATAVAGVASPGLRNAVRGGFEHALCIVTGDACDALAREPCPTLRTIKTTGQGLSFSYLRLGHDRVLAIERRSDGSYAMSLIEGMKAGLGWADEVRSGGGTFSAEAAMMLGRRAGRTYEVATPQEALALVERLRSEQLPATRALVLGAADLAGLVDAEPGVSSYVLAGDAALEALGRFGFGGLFGGGGKVALSKETGVRISAKEQEVTAYTTLDARAGVFFEALNEIAGTIPGRKGGGGAKGGAGSGGGGVDLTKPGSADRGPDAGPNRVTVKNPLAQKLEGEAVAGGSIALRFGPGPELLGVEAVGYVGKGDTQREIRVRMDPSDPQVRAAIATWRHDPTSPEQIAALGRAAQDRSAIDVRTFDTTRTEHKHGGQVSVKGHKIGLGFGSESAVSALVEQQSKPVGGEWEDRTDCVAVKTT